MSGSKNGNPRNKNGSARRKLRMWLRSQGRPCWICRAAGLTGEIDYSLPAGHPYSFEVDELVPVSKGGSPLDRGNVDAAHRCCNQWRGNKSVEEVLEIARGAGRSGKPSAPSPEAYRVDGTTSRDW